jgi:hypothetical protein
LCIVLILFFIRKKTTYNLASEDEHTYEVPIDGNDDEFLYNPDSYGGQNPDYLYGGDSTLDSVPVYDLSTVPQTDTVLYDRANGDFDVPTYATASSP